MTIRAVSLFSTVMLLSVPAPSQAQWSLEVLGPLDGRQTIAAAVNDRGDVVGYSWNAEGVQIPFLWTRKTGYVTFLGDAGGIAIDINNRGEIVGVLYPSSAAFSWSSAGGLINLGTGFLPMAVNEAGVIVGACEDLFGRGPCVWERGVVRSLGAPFGGTALALNAPVTVVGHTYLENTDRERPFVWSEHRGLRMLPVPSDTYSLTTLSASRVGSSARSPVAGLKRRATS